MAPSRVQLRRTAGWRKPDGAVVVARPSRWGNPFRADDYRRVVWPMGAEEPVSVSLADRRRFAAVDFEAMLLYGIGPRGSYPSDDEIRAHLAGRDLCCWCPIDSRCHADTLLVVANRVGRVGFDG